jgi:tRNA(Ile)-lysidine synthase
LAGFWSFAKAAARIPEDLQDTKLCRRPMKDEQIPKRNATPAWLDRVRRRTRRWIDLGAGTTWVVAVSGGGDSVGLLRVLHHLAAELGLMLTVAHLDHGTRGEAARADAALVEKLAEALGLPFDHGQWRPARASHFEADARRARYTWLLEMAAARGATAIALGHTCDDQAETILHRIVRGTGLRGLAGMPARRVIRHDPRVILVRPLLSVSRAAIREFLETIGQPFREDATNADQARTRGRIRHNLLPLLAHQYNPRVSDAIIRLGMLARASEANTQRQVTDLTRKARRAITPNEVELAADLLRQVPHFLRVEVFRRTWRLAGWPEVGMSERRWRRLAALVRSRRNVRASIGGGVELWITGPKGASASLCVLRRLGGGASESHRRNTAPSGT